jgi:hypothetical protein
MIYHREPMSIITGVFLSRFLHFLSDAASFFCSWLDEEELKEAGSDSHGDYIESNISWDSRQLLYVFLIPCTNVSILGEKTT